MLRKITSYFALYGAHALKVFSFVILIPHFTHVLSKSAWGKVVIVQAFALWLQIIVEYGFNLSGTRSVAQVRDNKDLMGELVANITFAKLILSIVAFLIALVFAFSLYQFVDIKLVVMLGALYAIFQALSPAWYFLGKEKFGQFSALDFLGRLIYLVTCLIFVRNDNDIDKIFILGIFSPLISILIGYYIIYKECIIKFPSLKGISSVLKDGFEIFIFLGITGVYTSLNVLILGSSQSSATVAAYGTADRVVRAAGGLLEPINRVIFSRMSNLFQSNFNLAIANLKKASILLVTVAMTIFILGEFISPIIVEILFPKYPESIIYLKILFLYIPILALNNIVGLQVMLPLGMDKAFRNIFISVSLISLFLMSLLLPKYGALGMSYIVVFTEIMAFMAMALFVIRSPEFKREQKDAKTT